jgi:hypothetical protein
VAGGRTLDDTLLGVDGAFATFNGRVAGLVGNELHRAAAAGADIALTAARRDHDIIEVWVTTGDHLVCPICEALHLTVTRKQPVTDSHPGCRCWKVPIPANYQPNSLSYAAFLSSLGVS